MVTRNSVITTSNASVVFKELFQCSCLESIWVEGLLNFAIPTPWCKPLFDDILDLNFDISVLPSCFVYMCTYWRACSSHDSLPCGQWVTSSVGRCHSQNNTVPFLFKNEELMGEKHIQFPALECVPPLMFILLPVSLCWSRIHFLFFQWQKERNSGSDYCGSASLWNTLM
jgi:hypothetical protein